MEVDRNLPILSDFNSYRRIPLDKYRLPLYTWGMPKSVPIRVRKETRAKLHSMKNPGQSLDGFITQLIDLWAQQKARGGTTK